MTFPFMVLKSNEILKCNIPEFVDEKNTVLVVNCKEIVFWWIKLFGQIWIASITEDPLGIAHYLGQICGVCKNGTLTSRHQDNPRHAM